MSYSFNSNALGFGGILTAPKRATIPSIASSCLSPTGGFGSSTVTNYRYEDIIFIGEARSEVYGSQTGDGFAARARVLLTNVDIKDVFHADYLEGNVFSVKAPGHPLPLITFSAFFEGVSIKGATIEPELDITFFNDRPRYDDVAATLLPVVENAEAVEVPDELTAKVQTDQETIRATLVRDFKSCPPEFRKGKLIEVPQFGKVYLAEVFVKRNKRRLSMLRLSLDPGTGGVESKEPGGVSGDFIGGNVDSNGTEITP